MEGSWPQTLSPERRDATLAAAARLRSLLLGMPPEERARVLASYAPNPYERYQNDPVGYARDVLHQNWWSKQIEVAEAVRDHPRVAVASANGVGKSHSLAGLVNWWFDSFRPSVGLTSAPAKAQVEDILWRQIRDQRADQSVMSPKAPHMERSSLHYATGYTAQDASSFQGRHEERLMVAFDEAVGISAEFFEAAEGMCVGANNRFVCIYNPTDPTSRMHMEEKSGRWHRIRISALEHPNIVAQLAGQPMPFPRAVSLEWVAEKVEAWCSPVPLNPRATDLEWPPGAGLYYRPGPIFESRVLGLWPSSGIDNVWSDACWLATQKRIEEPQDQPCIIGADIAWRGDDASVFVVRRGPCLLHMEAHNGWLTPEVTGRLKELCREWGAHCGQDATQVSVNVDDGGIGGAITDNSRDTGPDGRWRHWAWQGVTAQSVPLDPEAFPKRRSELWFVTRDRAESGECDFTRIDSKQAHELQTQLQAPKYKLDSRGRREVEPKDETKKRIGRSPDHADAVNLAFVGRAPRRRFAAV